MRENPGLVMLMTSPRDETANFGMTYLVSLVADAVSSFLPAGAMQLLTRVVFVCLALLCATGTMPCDDRLC